MTAKVILNPHSNRWKSQARWPEVEAALKAAGVDFDVVVSEKKGAIVGLADAEQHQRAIFEEFRRLDRTSPWGEQGLGIGLSICDRIARLLGLELGVRSRAGHGSVFSVRVPVSTSSASTPVPAPAHADASTSTPASLVGLTVLVHRQRARDPRRHERADVAMGRPGGHRCQRV